MYDRFDSSFTGYLPTAKVARILAAADAVVLPFLHGSGEWNTSVSAAQIQGTSVLTTSKDKSGYDRASNTYFASPQDIDGMRNALKKHLGTRIAPNDLAAPKWIEIRRAHETFCRSIIRARKIYV